MFVPSDFAFNLFSYFGWCGAHGDARRFHRRDFVFRLAATARYDRPRMPHPPPRRRGLPGDESNYRLLDVVFDIRRRGLFRGAADLANHDDDMRLWILVKEPDRIRMRRADDRIAANADTGGLADSQGRELANRFIRQGARSGDDTDVSGFVNVRRHNSDLALTG